MSNAKSRAGIVPARLFACVLRTSADHCVFRAAGHAGRTQDRPGSGTREAPVAGRSRSAPTRSCSSTVQPKPVYGLPGVLTRVGGGFIVTTSGPISSVCPEVDSIRVGGGFIVTLTHARCQEPQPVMVLTSFAPLPVVVIAGLPSIALQRGAKTVNSGFFTAIGGSEPTYVRTTSSFRGSRA